jgi:hypothetical protein
MTNYAFSIGDTARSIHQPSRLRGAFACGMTSELDDILDGLTNTIAMGEIGTRSQRWIIGDFAIYQSADILEKPSLCLDVREAERPLFYAEQVRLGEPGRGGRWADGAAGFGLVNTVLPPNSPSCAVGATGAVDGVYSTGSFHQGGGHVLMADGAVIFMTESIEAGDASRPTLTSQQLANDAIPSPYGLWGALGTAAGLEVVEESLNQ